MISREGHYEACYLSPTTWEVHKAVAQTISAKSWGLQARVWPSWFGQPVHRTVIENEVAQHLAECCQH